MTTEFPQTSYAIYEASRRATSRERQNNGRGR